VRSLTLENQQDCCQVKNVDGGGSYDDDDDKKHVIVITHISLSLSVKDRNLKFLPNTFWSFKMKCCSPIVLEYTL